MRNIIGPRIQQARRMRNLTQQDLAVRLQIKGSNHTRNTIAKIENGFRQVTDIEAKIFADILGVSVAWLFQEGIDADS